MVYDGLPAVVGAVFVLHGGEMSDLGLGVMINMLGGNEESVKAFQRGINHVISALELKDDALHFTFDDGYRMKLSDEGQSCCESRYMRTDDDLSQYIGSMLVSAEVAPGPDTENDDYGVHEVSFLRVTTSKGVFVMSSHNEHNGYYGGFWIVASAG